MITEKPYMSITVKRRTKYIRAFAPIYLKINSRTLARILENEDKELPLLKSESLLSVRASKRSQIAVSSGDVIIIKDNPKNALAFWLGLLTLMLAQFIFEPGSWSLAILGWLGMAGIIASFIIPRFLLEKADA